MCRRTSCHHRADATSATRSKETPLAVSAAAAKITDINEALPQWRGVRVENLRNQAVSRTLQSSLACTLRRAEAPLYRTVGWAPCRTEGGALYRPSVCLLTGGRLLLESECH